MGQFIISKEIWHLNEFCIRGTILVFYPQHFLKNYLLGTPNRSRSLLIETSLASLAQSSSINTTTTFTTEATNLNLLDTSKQQIIQGFLNYFIQIYLLKIFWLNFPLQIQIMIQLQQRN